SSSRAPAYRRGALPPESEVEELRFEAEQVDHTDAVVPRQVACALARVEDERAVAALAHGAGIVAVERDLGLAGGRAAVARVVHDQHAAAGEREPQRRVVELEAELRAGALERRALDVVVAVDAAERRIERRQRMQRLRLRDVARMDHAFDARRVQEL